MAGPFQTMKTQPMFPQNSGFARQGHALLVRSGSGPGAEILVPHVAWLQVVGGSPLKNGKKHPKVTGGSGWWIERFVILVPTRIWGMIQVD